MGGEQLIMTKDRKLIVVLVFLFLLLLSSCSTNKDELESEDYSITNIKIFKDTPVWELALAVDEENIDTIDKIAKDHPELVDYQDKVYGATLLLWSIGMEKYDSAEMLLKCGADPNITSKTEWKTPLFTASGFSWVDKVAKKDSKYVELLLSFGANPNINHYNECENYIIEPGASPLMYSIRSGIDKTKALVQAGADINYRTERGSTAALESLYTGEPQYAYYLIVEKKAVVSEPYYRRKSYGNEDPNEKLYYVDLLRYWIFDLDSQEYRMKMEIVDEFANQGVDYWKTSVPDSVREQIKKLYPTSWEDYIKKY